MTSPIRPKQLMIPLGLFLLMMIFAAACDQQGQGFALPQGDVEKGQSTFIRLACNECHSVGEIKWGGNDENMHITLGGKTPSTITYGELITSVINPSHKIAKRYQETTADEAGNSKMRIYNEVMSVQELVDIVTFLQTEYELTPPPTNYYPPF